MGSGTIPIARDPDPDPVPVHSPEGESSLMHTSILSSQTRYDLGETVICRVEPEGWIEGTIVKRDFEEIPYHIALKYNGEVVGCPVDSDW